MVVLDGEEITTEKGCFYCSHFKNCVHVITEKAKGRDFNEILIFDDGMIEYRYGCGCSGYRALREKVQFS